LQHTCIIQITCLNRRRNATLTHNFNLNLLKKREQDQDMRYTKPTQLVKIWLLIRRKPLLCLGIWGRKW